MKIAIAGTGHMGSWLARELSPEHPVAVYDFEYSFEEHDRMMAYSLTTPFVSSLVFAACVDARAVPGTTFKRHMTIARSLLAEDDHLLAEILFNAHSLQELGKITARLEFLKHIIMARDQEEASRFFSKLRQNIGTEGTEAGAVANGQPE